MADSGDSEAERMGVDAHGLEGLRLARVIREADRAVTVADDPVASAEIAKLAAERSWTAE